MDMEHEDTYFLDRELAYLTALEHNTITLKDGQKTAQVCYYDGQAFGHAPDNLIHVPLEKITEYFASHNHRIPTRIEPHISSSRIDPYQLQNRLACVLNAVQLLKKPNN